MIRNQLENCHKATLDVSETLFVSLTECYTHMVHSCSDECTSSLLTTHEEGHSIFIIQIIKSNDTVLHLGSSKVNKIIIVSLCNVAIYSRRLSHKDYSNVGKHRHLPREDCLKARKYITD